VTFSTARRVLATGLAQVASYPPGAIFGPRRLTDYEFVWVVKGEGRWTTTQNRGEELTISPGIVNLARRGSTERYRWTNKGESRHAFVHFQFCSSEPEEGEADWPLRRSLTSNPVLAGLCGYLLDLAASGAAIAQSRTDDVLALLLDLFVAGPLEGELAAPLSPAVLLALEHVRKVWVGSGMSLVSNSSMARAVNLSTSYLGRLFHDEVGAGPARVIEAARLAKAGMMLQRTNLKIREVSAACGFADEFHLSTRFALHYSMPPGRYRLMVHDPMASVPDPALRAAIAFLLAPDHEARLRVDRLRNLSTDDLPR
jgi:AraC family transcriptional regulator